jgi:hypothetical protein
MTLPDKNTPRVDAAFSGGSTLEAALAEAAEDAETAETNDGPLPAHVKVTRGHGRSKVLQIRLNDDELTELERVAATRGPPPSTVAREAILRHLYPDEARQVEGKRLAAELRRFVNEFMTDGQPPGKAQPAVIRKAKINRGGRVVRSR